MLFYPITEFSQASSPWPNLAQGIVIPEEFMVLTGRHRTTVIGWTRDPLHQDASGKNNTLYGMISRSRVQSLGKKTRQALGTPRTITMSRGRTINATARFRVLLHGTKN
jgi:hypothetical protein